MQQCEGRAYDFCTVPANHSKCPASWRIAANHRLVQITEEIDWTELEELVQAIRPNKLKNAAGRRPHLRAWIGALVLRAMRYRTFRDLEDLIRYCAPARLLCGLTETDWSRRGELDGVARVSRRPKSSPRPGWKPLTQPPATARKIALCAADEGLP